MSRHQTHNENLLALQVKVCTAMSGAHRVGNASAGWAEVGAVGHRSGRRGSLGTQGPAIAARAFMAAPANLAIMPCIDASCWASLRAGEGWVPAVSIVHGKVLAPNPRPPATLRDSLHHVLIEHLGIEQLAGLAKRVRDCTAPLHQAALRRVKAGGPHHCRRPRRPLPQGSLQRQ